MPAEDFEGAGAAVDGGAEGEAAGGIEDYGFNSEDLALYAQIILDAEEEVGVHAGQVAQFVDVLKGFAAAAGIDFVD